MGHDFLAISHVELSNLPPNAQGYAECMYRTDTDNYYEIMHDGQPTYYRATNATVTNIWSIRLQDADTLRATFQNHNVPFAETLFVDAGHTPNTLIPLLNELRQIDRSSLDNHTGTLLMGLINILAHACKNGVLLSL